MIPGDANFVHCHAMENKFPFPQLGIMPFGRLNTNVVVFIESDPCVNTALGRQGSGQATWTRYDRPRLPRR